MVVRLVNVDSITGSMWPKLVASLNVDERNHAARFIFERHRHTYIAAHALKRLMLTIHTRGQVAPAAWAFETAPGGKPYVHSTLAPRFNLSHCEGLVACALSHVVELGIDVEPLRPAPLDVAARYFAEQEVKWLHDQPHDTQSQAFLRLWTLKEAYIKATGLGLAQSLQEFAFDFDPIAIRFSDAALGDAGRWQFDQRVIDAEHLLALAWQDAPVDFSLDVASVSFETLLMQAKNI